MLPAKIMLEFHFMWFDWHDMVTKVPVLSASGIKNVPPSPDLRRHLAVPQGVFRQQGENAKAKVFQDAAEVGRGGRLLLPTPRAPVLS